MFEFNVFLKDLIKIALLGKKSIVCSLILFSLYYRVWFRVSFGVGGGGGDFSRGNCPRTI